MIIGAGFSSYTVAMSTAFYIPIHV